jgi:putative tricarboxylic transport membrane protein
MRKDLVTAALLLAVAVGYFHLAGGINESTLADEFGAAGLPVIYAYLLALLAVALALRAGLVTLVARRAATPRAADHVSRWHELARAAGLLAIGIGYVAIVSQLGYFLSCAAVIGLVAWYQGAPARWPLVAVALGGAALYTAFFRLLLRVEMPAGILAALWEP